MIRDILFVVSISSILVSGFQGFSSWQLRSPSSSSLRRWAGNIGGGKYPLSPNYYEKYVRRLNSNNITVQDASILGLDDRAIEFLRALNNTVSSNYSSTPRSPPIRRRAKRGNGGIRIIIGPNGIHGIPDSDFDMFGSNSDEDDDEDEDDEDDDEDEYDEDDEDDDAPSSNNNGFGFSFGNGGGGPRWNSNQDENFASFKRRASKKSENFEVVTDFPIRFSDVGGYDNVKAELSQCVDILSNFTKYTKFNVRIPKGLIFEGPPGNGKTLLAKALAGEAQIAFIAVSGSQFQEKYVGVGSSRIRELFELAKKNAPVIVFIDEIDAVGRRRSGDGEQSGTERDNTLNELLVALDGFKNSSGIFLVGATNRADLLDPALLRPGRVDKRIFIGNPDEKTREAILRIHTQGKPYDAKISLANLVDITSGLSGAQIENLVNEAMLNALRYNREMIINEDIDFIMNKMMVGWQPNEHKFTPNIIDHIAIHEMGHAVLGLLSKHHSKMTKVVINLSAPTSPAYTVFENSDQHISTREGLFEHLMILLGGRIAEEVFYNVSVTTGAISDFEEALKLAERMVLHYGMGKMPIYPSTSEKYQAIVDDEVLRLIQDAYKAALYIIHSAKDFVWEAAELLKRDSPVQADVLSKMILCKYPFLLLLPPPPSPPSL